MIKKNFAWALLAIVCCSAPLLPSMAKKEVHREIHGDQVFQQHCASCHAGGGNRVSANRPVAGSKELATLAHFKSYLSAPPGHMPYYQDIVRDEKTLKALYQYCKTLKRQPLKQARIQTLPSKKLNMAYSTHKHQGDR